MRLTIFTFMLLCLINALSAQNKYDYIWILGYGPGTIQQMQGGDMIDFNQSPPIISYFNIPIAPNFTVSTCDSSGQLLMYCDGCRIINREHQLMDNGDQINEGVFHDDYCEDNFGYPTRGGLLLLPDPGNPNKYYLFHIRDVEFGFCTDLLYSVVDMTGDNGLGTVIEKNHLILQDSLADEVTGVRHGNGRDWWIIAPSSSPFVIPGDDAKRYYVFLLDPTGVHGPYTQVIGAPWDNQYWSGQATCSPDGSKYARMSPFNGLHIFDFDRCNGTLSNPVDIYFPDDTIYSAGVAFSPNSRYLYVSASLHVYQFDMQAPDIESSKQLIATWDGFASPSPSFTTEFYHQMLAPDNKIYITCPNSVDVLHVINQPDLPGTACDLVQHGVMLPALHAFAAPNFPHFRLLDLAGSPCDTLGINTPVLTPPPPKLPHLIQVSPNPASGPVLLSWDQSPEAGATLSITDNTGRKLWDLPLAPGDRSIRIDVSGIPDGIYFLRIVAKYSAGFSGKMVVGH